MIMDISVVIRSHRDIRVLDCIESVDSDVGDIVVVLTERGGLAREVEATGVRLFFARPGRLGASIAVGLEHCKMDKVIIADSDCVFGTGYIKRVYELLDSYDIVRGRLKMLSEKGILSAGTRMVAANREYVYNLEEHMFLPGLGLRRSLSSSLGGLLFDPNLVRAVDLDFEQRAIDAGCSFFFDRTVEIIHAPESLRHDMKAAWLTGRSTEFLSRKGRGPGAIPSGLFNFILQSIGVNRFGLYKQIASSYGLGAAFYHHVWSVVFHAGYLYGSKGLISDD